MLIWEALARLLNRCWSALLNWLSTLLTTHSHGNASVVRATTQVNGEPEIRPINMLKPLKRSSPKVAYVWYVITFWIPTHMQNLVTIPQGVSFPHMREIAHQKCLLGFFFSGFFQRATANCPLNRFWRKIFQTTRSAQGYFFGLEN